MVLGISISRTFSGCCRYFVSMFLSSILWLDCGNFVQEPANVISLLIDVVGPFLLFPSFFQHASVLFVYVCARACMCVCKCVGSIAYMTLSSVLYPHGSAFALTLRFSYQPFSFCNPNSFSWKKKSFLVVHRILFCT